jgi:alanyl-tRNA synthetase
VTTPNTEKLYLDDPYAVSFRARVLRWETDARGRVAAVLDRSGFYPESGGQTADRGAIGNAVVVDVQEGEGDTVRHYVEGGQRPQVGEEADCRVDWDRRFDHMQQHTGQHVLSRAFIATAGLYTVSFHMGEEACTIDLEGSGYGPEVADRAEDLANSIVFENRAVSVRTVAVDEPGAVDGKELRRSLPEGVTEVRLVEVEGFDTIPCCGTHVRTTGELGVIKVLKAEKVKGLHRVHFKVGGRAVRDYRDKHDVVQRLSNRLTTSAADVAANVDKLIDEGQQARKRLKRLSLKLADYEARAIVAEVDKEGGKRIVVRHFDEGDDEFVKQVSVALRREPETIAVLSSAAGGVICCASEGVDVDFARIAVERAKAAGGSGGGRGPFAQLKLPEGADVRRFLEEIEDDVRRSFE